MRNNQGFTLIELMIVVAIIAILAAIAISQYQDYVIRSQVAEGASLADGIKTAVAEFTNNYGRFPNDGGSDGNASLGLATGTSIVGTYVSRTHFFGTIVHVHYTSTAPFRANTAIAGRLLVFSPITHAGSIEWHCNSQAGTSILNKYRPSICRD